MKGLCAWQLLRHHGWRDVSEDIKGPAGENFGRQFGFGLLYGHDQLQMNIGTLPFVLFI